MTDESVQGAESVEHGADDERIERYDEGREYTASELCQVCRLAPRRLFEYLEHGVVTTIDGPGERFTHIALHRLVRAVRVHRELEVELPNLGLVMDLLERIERQRRELDALRRETGRRQESGRQGNQRQGG